MAETPFINKYLGGYDHVTQALAAVLKAAREKKGMSNDALDRLLGFGAYENRKGSQTAFYLPLPASEVYERDPRKINSLVFSLASFPLKLSCNGVLRDHVLPRKLEEAELGEILAFMRENGCGWRGIPPEVAHVEVFLAIRMMNEIDEVAREQVEEPVGVA